MQNACWLHVSASAFTSELPSKIGTPFNRALVSMVCFLFMCLLAFSTSTHTASAQVTITKTGVSAGGVNVPAEIGETIDWTVVIDNQSVPDITDVVIDDLFDTTTQTYVSGSLTVPSNFTITDGIGSDGSLSVITDFVSTGKLRMLDTSSANVGIFKDFNDSGGGDGYTVRHAMVNGVLTIYWVNHHNPSPKIKCWEPMNDQFCPSHNTAFPSLGTSAQTFNNEELTMMDDRYLYGGFVASDGNGYWCFDVTTGAFCSHWASKIFAPVQNVFFNTSIISSSPTLDPTTRRMFLSDQFGNVHCFYGDTGLPCRSLGDATAPYLYHSVVSTGLGANQRTQMILEESSGMLFFTQQNGTYCISISDNSNPVTCSGWPAGSNGSAITLEGSGEAYFLRNASGIPKTLCWRTLYAWCMPIDGSVGVAPPAGINGSLDPSTVYPTGISGLSFPSSSYDELTNKIYFTVNWQGLSCWDFNTQSSCNIDKTISYPYGFHAAPEWGCGWSNSHAGFIKSYNLETLESPCKVSNIVVDYELDWQLEYCSADTSTAIGSWDSFFIDTLDASKFKSYSAALYDNPNFTGTPLFTYNDVASTPQSGNPQSFSSLADVSLQANSKFYFRITAEVEDLDDNPFASDNPNRPIVRTDIQTSLPAELCLQTEVTTASCSPQTHAQNDVSMSYAGGDDVGLQQSSAQVQTAIVGGCPTLKIGDQVWVDTNANGVMDGTESGLDAITVSVYSDVGGVPTGPVVGSTQTDVNGLYAIDYLTAGTYCVEVTPPGSPYISLSSELICGVVIDDVVGSYLDADFAYNWEPIDLIVRKSASPAIVNEGNQITYTIEVENTNLNLPTQNVEVADTFTAPVGVGASLTTVSEVPSNGTYDTTTGIWTVPVLAAGATEQLVLTYTVGSIGSVAGVNVTNNAALTSAPPSGDDPDNNADDASVTVYGNQPRVSTVCNTPTLILDWDNVSWPMGASSQTFAVGGVDVRITFTTNMGAILSGPDNNASQLITVNPGNTLSISTSDNSQIWVDVEFFETGTTTPLAVRGAEFTVGDISKTLVEEFVTFSAQNAGINVPLGSLIAGPGSVVVTSPTTVQGNGSSSADAYATASWSNTTFVTDARAELLNNDAAEFSLSDISFCQPEAPEIGVAKSVTSAVFDGYNSAGDSIYLVEFNVRVRNTGNVILANLQLLDDIYGQNGGAAGAFVEVVGQPSFVTMPTDTNSSLNLATDWLTPGVTQTDLLDATAANALAVGDETTIQYSVKLNRDAPNAPETMTNQVTANGTAPNDAVASDLSDDGTQPEGDNDYGHSDDPTYIPVYGTGVVYDAMTRLPVAGAKVYLVNLTQGGTPVPNVCLQINNALPPGQAFQLTNAMGEYNIDMLPQLGANPLCPAGDEYGINIVADHLGYFDVDNSGTGAPSLPSLSSVAGTFVNLGCAVDTTRDEDVGLYGCQIQQTRTPPALNIPASETDYHLRLDLTDAPIDRVFNNNIPLMPAPVGYDVIKLSKKALNTNVTVGEFIHWQIDGVSTVKTSLVNTQVIDLLPAGLTYLADSAHVTITDGNTVPSVQFAGKLEPSVSGLNLTWSGINIPPEGRVSIRLTTVVGTGVPIGPVLNSVKIEDAFGRPLSPIVVARSLVIADPTFDCAGVVGRVFNDMDHDGYHSNGENGLVGIRLVTATGKSVKTDVYGRYHVPCAMIPNADRGTNFLLKLDERTLPLGYRVTSENPRVIRLTRGKLSKMNFGVSISRVVRLSLQDEAFVGNTELIDIRWQSGLEELVKQAAVGPSVLKITYRSRRAGRALGEARLDNVIGYLKARFKQLGLSKTVEFETEFARIL